MGILQDTIRDARRPLGSHWVQRAAMDEAETGLPDEDTAAPGMQTVFRFQKEGPVRPREASSQLGGVGMRLQAGDPLSAGVEAERRKSPAHNNVGPIWNGITDRTKNRGSTLERGREEHGSPSKIAAVSTEIASEEEVRSLNVPGPTEAKQYRAKHKSKVPDGGEKPASRYEESSWSQPTGRGAPSETYLSPWAAEAAQPEAFAAEAIDRVAGLPELPSPPTTRAEQDAKRSTALEIPTPQPARRASRREEPLRPAATLVQPTTPATPQRGQPATPSPVGEERRNSPNAATSHFHFPGNRPAPPAATPSRSAPPATAAAEPGLVIGRIDVVVVAREAQVQPAARADGNRGFLSRNYLKRL